MDTETNLQFEQDQQAVQAVRGGDAERYRELVERHERRVFALAWSRLGDAALAEEVAQEAFIRGYRRLWLLGDGAKFSGWIAAITRRLAINCGLRNRRELNKRQRWAVEQTAAPADEPAELCPPETLREALAGLPAAHRECLVLFYLEGKSGAEAAAALGISETALRVRLHRARAALRERLEEKLEGSLAKLRPAKTLVPAVMAGVLASSSAKAATAGGMGATILAALAKFTPFKWLFAFGPLLFPLIMFLPGLLLHRWQRRDEQRNYRDAKGFRASLHRQIDKSHPLFLLFLFVVLVYLVCMTTSVLNTKNLFLVFGLFALVTTVFAARQLQINRSLFQLGVLLNGLIMGAVFLCVWLGWLSVLIITPTLVLSALLTLLTNRSRPAQTRMDSNLFLRATQGMLPSSDAPGRKELSIRFDRAALRAFARFLGERQLARDFRWRPEGLILYLPGVKSPLRRTWNRIFPSVRNDSNITLGWDGLVTARCGRIDAAGLRALPSNSVSDLGALEHQVATAVSEAWRNFREGKTALAEKAIGQIPDADIFVVPPTRTRANRWQHIVFGGMMGVSLILLGTVWLFPEKLSGQKPVSVTEAQVRAFLNDTTPNPNPSPRKYRFNDSAMALWNCLVLPPTNLFSAEGLGAMRAEVLLNSGLTPQIKEEWKPAWLCNSPQVKRAIGGGWIGWDDVNLKPRDVAEFLHGNQKANELQFTLEFLLTHEKAWSWVGNRGWDVERVGYPTLVQLRWLRDVNCLDLVDRAELIRQIASVQVLSGTPPGQPPIHDWRDVRGLFFTPCWPALQDTYYSVAALEILGGLDEIDRRECVRGILRRHHGKGFFDSPSSGSYNEYKIDGSARDTFAAFESLRILGALDRVKDLDKWQFRLASYRSSKRDANGARTLTWDEVEAWVCQQRLARDLAEHKENPAAPWRSLLEP